MKKVQLTLILVMILGNIIFAQDEPSKSYDMGKQARVTNNSDSNDFTFSFSISEGMITTAVIFGEIVILLLVLYYWKRTRNDSKSEADLSYKKNIRAIRDERIRPALNSKSSSQRKALKKYVQNKAIDGRTISTVAKKMSIAKSEIFLATRIQQLQNQTR